MSSYQDQCDREELEALVDQVKFRCATCSTEEKPKYDMHGMAIFEEIGGQMLATGVICRECQDIKVELKSFLKL